MLIMLTGAYLHWVDVENLTMCSSEVRKDPSTFGIACTKRLPQFQEVIVEYPSDIRRLKTEAAASVAPEDAEAHANADYLVIANATLLTMETGDYDDILEDAIIVSRGGQIEAIVGAQDALPYGATVFNAEGGASSTPVPTSANTENVR